jgi:hypothetical protein
MATTRKPRNNKITRVILPALFETPGLTINEIVDPRTGKPVEALYFYAAAAVEDKDGNPLKPVIEQTGEDVRTGKQGRPAKRWKLTKSTRDRMVKQAKREAAKAAEASVEATPEPALV